MSTIQVLRMSMFADEMHESTSAATLKSNRLQLAAVAPISAESCLITSWFAGM